jgi:hypothetical protein
MRARPLAFAAAVAAGVAVPALAYAEQSNEQIETLKKGINDACRPDLRGGGVIAPKDVRKALIKAYPLLWDWDGNAPPDAKGMVRLIERAGLDPNSTQGNPNRGALNQIGYLTLGWSTPNDARGLTLTQGGIEITNARGGALRPADYLAVLRAIFLNEGTDQFRFVCGKSSAEPAPTAPTALEVPPPQITVAKSEDQLGKGGSDQKAGELGFIDDQVKGSTKFATTMAVGVAIPIFRPREQDRIRGISVDGASLIPFVSYNRQGATDPSDDSYVNNLSLGVATNGYLAFRDPGKDGAGTLSIYYSLSGRYETDDRLHSDAWFAAVQLQPILPIPGNTTPFFPFSGRKLEAGFSWTAAGAFDHSSVSDPWKKKGLLDTKHFTRLGTEFTGAFILRPTWGNGDWSLRLEVGQSHRWNLGRGDGTAHLHTTKLVFQPMEDYSIGIGYDQGTELDSLAEMRQWKVTVGIKR